MKYTTPKSMLLLEALCLCYPESSKTAIREWIRDGRIALEGRVIHGANKVLAKGSSIELLPKKKYIDKIIPVLYEDAHFVVIDKPAGLLSVSTNFQKEDTAFAMLKRYYKNKNVYVIHRLDQDTSGVMLFAFTEEATEKLKVLFEKHDIVRRYCAIVEGYPATDEGTWQSYLWEDGKYFVHSSPHPCLNGELAITHYKVVKKRRQFCRLDVTLETGKKNQIRVHCKNAGHPVAGDKKYGAKTDYIDRLCLHACHLEFVHPITEKNVCFESDIPEEFFRLIRS